MSHVVVVVDADRRTCMFRCRSCGEVNSRPYNSAMEQSVLAADFRAAHTSCATSTPRSAGA